MPPLSSIFSRGHMSEPLSNSAGLSTASKPTSSIFSDQVRKKSSSVFHGAQQLQQGSTSVFHPAGQVQRGLSSISHSTDGSVTAQTYEQVNRDAALDDARYRHARDGMRERQANEQTKEERVLGRFGTGRAMGTAKSFKKNLSHLIKSLPTKYKNLSVSDQKYFQDKVRDHAKKLPIGSGFDLRVRKKIKHEIYKDTQEHKVSQTDRKDFDTLIDQLSR